MTYYGQGLDKVSDSISRVAKSIDKLAGAATTAADAYAKTVGRKNESIVYNITVETRTGASAAEVADSIKRAVRARP